MKTITVSVDETVHRRARLQNELLQRLDAEGRGVIVAQRLDRQDLHARAGNPRSA